MCDSKRILQAISILKQLNEKYYEKAEKKSLLDDETENPIILQITMKKIPPPTMTKFVKVHLPKSLLNDKKEVCLITGDLDKRNTKAELEPDVLHFKELLKKENISKINEVITLRQLRKEYKPYEARRQLCGAYDVFLCDKRIAGVLPNALGKSFFKKRKLPIQINMQTPKLKEQIENALSSTVFHITCKGNSCASEVADISMFEKDILSNVTSAIDALKEHLPGQWENILGIYMKTKKSKAIPLYMSNDDPNDFSFSKKRNRTKCVVGELSTSNAEVKVYKDGRVIVKKAKYDVSDNEEEDLKNDIEEEKVIENISVQNSEEIIDSDNEEEEPSEVKEEVIEDVSVKKLQKKKKNKSKNKTKKSIDSDNKEEDSSEVNEEVIENVPVQKLQKKKKSNNKTRKTTDSNNEEEDSQKEVAEEILNVSVEKLGKKRNNNKLNNKNKRKKN